MRENYFKSKNGRTKILRDGADGKMYFTTIDNIFSLDKNSREDHCVVYDITDIETMGDDMVFVIFDKEQRTLSFYEKWKIYFTEEVNMRRASHVKKEILIPHKLFKNIGGFHWVDDTASNVTWKAISDSIDSEPCPENIDYQVSLFKNVLRRVK